MLKESRLIEPDRTRLICIHGASGTTPLAVGNPAVCGSSHRAEELSDRDLGENVRKRLRCGQDLHLFSVGCKKRDAFSRLKKVWGDIRSTSRLATTAR